MRLLVALALCLPLTASGQGVSRPSRRDPAMIHTAYPNAALANTMPLGSFKFPVAVQITAAHMYVSTVGGGGAGNSVITYTDGTNSCTATVTCAASGSTGHKDAAVAGTCTFPAGATVTISVTTGSCTTTQPTVKTATAVGYFR